MTQSLRIVMAQLDFTVGDVAANADLIIESARKARDELDAQAIVYPELALTGYPPEDLLLRPGFVERCERALTRIQNAVTGIHMVIGHPHVATAGMHNAASVIRDGRVLAQAFKQHLPNYSVFDEKRYFVPGRDACVFEIEGIAVGVTICEDIWMPGPALQAAEAGARLLLNVNASPFHGGKRNERERVVAERARAAGVPVVYVNLVGGQDELVFDGESFVVDAQGVLTQRAPACVQELSPVEFSLDADAVVTPRPGPVADDLDFERRLYDVLVLGVRDYVAKNGFQGAVLGLSGGIDSALTLAIAADALGADKVEAVMMPSRYTSGMSRDDAAAQAEAMGVNYRYIPIEPAFEAFLGMLAEEFAGQPTDVTEENIQARCRGVILMAISNKQGKILLTTGNKSEMAVGYATLYGDMAGGFAPIKDVPKLLVYRLANYRNSIAPIIPQNVIDRPPSAELAPDQKDADSLPPYEVLDPLLERYVEQDESIDQIIAAGFDAETVWRVATLVDRNEYKRRQAPPGVRITQRAFGRDRRYPITSGYMATQRRGPCPDE